MIGAGILEPTATVTKSHVAALFGIGLACGALCGVVAAAFGAFRDSEWLQKL
jgi:hypothetical protein